MRAQPAPGRVAFAILFLGSLLRRDELRHQRKYHVMARSHDHRRQHGVIMLCFSVPALARKTLRATQLLRTEILRAIEGHQCPSPQPLKPLEAVALPQLLDNRKRLVFPSGFRRAVV